MTGCLEGSRIWKERCFFATDNVAALLILPSPEGIEIQIRWAQCLLASILFAEVR